jgi:CRISPR-associated protein Cas2
MGLKFFIVSYDIADEKRLTDVRNTLKGYGYRLHYSVYRCDIEEKDMVVLTGKLEGIINYDEDGIMIIDLGPIGNTSENRISYLGQKPEEHDNSAVIV